MFHEREVQDQIASRAALIFPGYHYAEFMGLIKSSTDSAKPDFVLVEQDYRRWYVGEVEMVRHDLTGHVLRQVRVFRDGEFNSEHVPGIIRHNPRLDAARLSLLIENVPPTVLVVVDKMDLAWSTAINSEGAKLTVFEVFREIDSSNLIFRVNGYSPEIMGNFLSKCSSDRSLPRLLRVLTPSSLPAKEGDRLEIVFDDLLTEWVLMVGEDKAWLNPVGHLEIPRDSSLDLYVTENGRLRLERK